MNIKCTDLDDLLFEGDSFAMQTAARHADGCPACSEKLAAWNDITATAQSLRTEWTSDLLWPRIQKALQQPVAVREAAAPTMWRVAAAVLLTVSVGATTWYAVRDGSREAAFDREIIRVSALESVERAEQAHLQAIEDLEKVADPKLENPQGPLMMSYREKLMLLDDAIAECQTNIENNRQNAHLRKQLLTMYSEKQRTLRDVVREGTNVSPQ